MCKLDSKNEQYIFNNNTIITNDKTYVLHDELTTEKIAFFEKNNPSIINGRFNVVKHKDLLDFVKMGTHYNCAVRFDRKIPSKLNHIDMTKAYSAYKQCKYYDGFLINITDFR